MRIGMILENPFPEDNRVEKEAKSLHKAGNEIYILSRLKMGSPFVEEYEHYTVVRFDMDRHQIRKRLTRKYKKIFFYDPVWAIGIRSFIKEYHIDVLHVHDLPLVKTAFKVAKKHRIPVVADYHEDYPAHLKATNTPSMTRMRRFYRSYKRWRRYEGEMSRKVGRIIVVVQEQRENLIRDHKIRSDKVTIVHNTIDIDKLKDTETDHIVSENEFVLSYIGGLAPHRGLDVVIGAMPKIISNIPQARLVIVGSGKGQIEKNLQDLAEQVNVSNYVRFLGWKKYAELPFYFRQANIGVIPHHHAYKPEQISSPNKLFEYMYFKVPLVVSDMGTLKRLIEETGGGLVFRTNDVKDFAEKLLEIYNSPINYGEMGYKAVMEKYNWSVDGERLVNLYKSLN